ncbi:fimbrial protein [Serratia fonticola]|jgi:type 1 fimbria pilin|uniref:fimbrial protein n=1 Tax=Serratia fonticola TaxID=47917 RepID=UPI00217782E9|nr:fimbrial protein [Serratia fonticola]CAI1043075.1 putative minor fimbrial subunit StfF [Serratia fonticola]CAI1172894.1 putative minor fimbrial subunit StfF [Serratia fonticola]CAI1758631.1 putative minor fimbrial subunit StfF [Serratia fonticola]HBE9181991.1 fimbrial protein [Serratia fonticola]
MSITIRILLLTCGLMGVVVPAQAKNNEADMTFHGTLITPPLCAINDDNRIEVNFGERIGINKVDGENYRQLMNYQITCQDAAGGNWALKLSLSGSAAGFDTEALMTDKANLGIRIYQNGQPFTPNSTLKIDLANPPRLEAVPVKKEGGTLIEGAFEAWATLRADYQ